MPRPQTDIEAGRTQLLELVEEMIRKRGAFDLSISDLAAAAGMSPSNIYRFFESKDALYEAIAERWFADKIAIMEEVVASDLPARDKMYRFFVRRFCVMRDRYLEEPELFTSYMEVGRQHFEVVRGYVDLGDHYLSVIVVEAQEQGHFAGLSIDRAVSLVNQMVQPYVNPDALETMVHKLTEEKLAQIIDTIFIGLGKSFEQANPGPGEPIVRIVS